MTRRPAGLTVLLATAAGACSFQPGGGAGLDGPTPPRADAGADAPTSTDDAGPGPDATSSSADARPPTCPPASGLQLCLTFEGLAVGAAPLTIADESSAARSLTVSSASIVDDSTRSGKALALTGMSRAETDGIVALGDTATIEAWVRVDQDPLPGQRSGVLDDSSAYSLFYYLDPSATLGRRWRCALGPPFFGPANGAQLGVWTHLACVCAQGVARLYVDGTEVASGSCDPVTVSRPVALGADRADDGTTTDYLTGRLDDIRLWSRALTPAEVCTTAGRASCP